MSPNTTTKLSSQATVKKSLLRPILKNTMLTLAIAAVAVPMSGCGSDDDDDVHQVAPTQNIVEIAADTSNLTLLSAALEASDLDNVLAASDTQYTVFAPTDEAFTELLGELGVSADELLDNKQLLTQVLTYHVLPSAVVKAADIPYGDSIETVNGQAFTISDANVIMDASQDTSDIIDTDILATNGVIHIIDDVLVPTDKSIVDLVLATDSLSILKEAVIAADLVNALDAGDANFTVFAPSNAAFEAALAELNMSKAELLANKALLTAVLKYHVIANDRVFASEIMKGEQAMLAGGNISFDENKDITDARGRKAKVTLANQQADNGVVHVIDKVLLPATD